MDREDGKRIILRIIATYMALTLLGITCVSIMIAQPRAVITGETQYYELLLMVSGVLLTVCGFMLTWWFKHVNKKLDRLQEGFSEFKLTIVGEYMKREDCVKQCVRKGNKACVNQ